MCNLSLVGCKQGALRDGLAVLFRPREASFALFQAFRSREIWIPYLRWVDALGTEQKFMLERDEVLIGRRTDSDIVFAHPFVSRQHAKLIKGEACYSILNLSEAHGTYV